MTLPLLTLIRLFPGLALISTLTAQELADTPEAKLPADAATALHEDQAELSPEFHPLFAEQDLSDGMVRGGTASYERNEEGDIVGKNTERGGINTFLCAPDEYHNFVLRFSFHIDSRLNSGVQIRSAVIGEQNGRDLVGGTQIEIDTDPGRDRQWSGGIYGERVEPWLYPAHDASDEDKEAFSEQGRELTHIDGWNEVVVLALGEHITTWFNGELRADMSAYPDGTGLAQTGLIGLQVHNVGSDELVPLLVRFRDLAIWELSDDADYAAVRAVVEDSSILTGEPAEHETP